MIIRGNNLEKWLFDYFEGNLTTHEKVELENFVRKNPAYQEEFDNWQKSYQTSIEDRNKSNRVPAYAGATALMVETGIIARINWRYAAAIITLITGGALGYLSVANSDNLPVEELAVVEEASQDDSSLIVSGPSEFTEGETTTNVVLASDSDVPASDVSVSNSVSNHVSGTNYSGSANQTSASVGGNSGNSNGNSIFNQFNASANQTGANQSGANQSNLMAAIDPQEDIESNFRKDNWEKEIVSLSSRPAYYAPTVSVEELEVNENYRKDKYGKDNYKFLDFRTVAGKGIKRKIKDKPVEDPLVIKNDPNDEGFMEIIQNRDYKKKGKNSGSKVQRKPSKYKLEELGFSNVHDPLFAKVNHEPIFENAALTGGVGLPRLKTSYRLQNTNQDQLFTRATVSYDQYIGALKGGVGVFAASNNFEDGMYKNNTFGMVYAQRFELDKESSFALGVKYTLENRSMDLSKMQYDTPIELERGRVEQTFADGYTPEVTNKTQHNLGLSAWYDGKYIYGGVQVGNLLKTNDFVVNEANPVGERVPVELKAQIGTDFRRTIFSNTVVSPQIMYCKKGDLQEIWGGVTLRHKWLVTGAGVSALNGISGKGLIGVQKNYWRVMYGYDHSKSALSHSFYGSHELSLRIIIGSNNPNWSRY